MIIIIPIGLIITSIRLCIRSCEEQRARARVRREYEQIVVQEEPRVTIPPPTAPYQQKVYVPSMNVPPPPYTTVPVQPNF